MKTINQIKKELENAHVLNQEETLKLKGGGTDKRRERPGGGSSCGGI